MRAFIYSLHCVAMNERRLSFVVVDNNVVHQVTSTRLISCWNVQIQRW